MSAQERQARLGACQEACDALGTVQAAVRRDTEQLKAAYLSPDPEVYGVGQEGRGRVSDAALQALTDNLEHLASTVHTAASSILSQLAFEARAMEAVTQDADAALARGGLCREMLGRGRIWRIQHVPALDAGPRATKLPQADLPPCAFPPPDLSQQPDLHTRVQALKAEAAAGSSAGPPRRGSLMERPNVGQGPPPPPEEVLRPNFVSVAGRPPPDASPA